MPKIKKPTPPEHIVIVDTNILWHEEKKYVVNPDFEKFWVNYSHLFPMQLIIPDIVQGEILYQQTTSALKLLRKANNEIDEISQITSKTYSHQVTENRIKKEISERFDAWISSKNAQLKPVPIERVNWSRVLNDSIWRELPFTPDAKNPKNEKGFRDCMILETVCSVCDSYSDKANIAFICGDYALRRAADSRLGSIESFTTFESLSGFVSFIELTRNNLRERFVKSILFRAARKFHNEKDYSGLIYKNNYLRKLRDEFKSDIDFPSPDNGLSGLNPFSVGTISWKAIGREQAWVTRPHFRKLVNENEYHWTSKITFARLFVGEDSRFGDLQIEGEKKLMVLAIEVHWKADVRNDGRFFKCEIIEHKKSNFTFAQATDDQLERYGIEKTINPKASSNKDTSTTND